MFRALRYASRWGWVATVVAIAAAGCSLHPDSPDSRPALERAKDRKTSVDTGRVQGHLRTLLEEDSALPRRLRNGRELAAQFYAGRNHLPAWLSDGGLRSEASELLE